MEPFQPDEEFKIIPDFKLYAVSNYGRVINIRFNRELTYSPTDYGELTVGMMKNGTQHRRSVKRLTARAWVPGESVLFDTAIQKDGDRNNIHYTNLAWRPRWFAWKYHRQFDQIPQWAYSGPVNEVKSQLLYETIYDAALYNGELFDDIRESIARGTKVFPTGHIYLYYK